MIGTGDGSYEPSETLNDQDSEVCEVLNPKLFYIWSIYDISVNKCFN